MEGEIFKKLNKMTTTAVLNTITASAADITLVSRKLNVAISSSAGSGKFPTIDYPSIVSASISPAITETLYVTRVGWTAASSTVFLFTINQMVDGLPLTKTAYYTSDSSGTDTEIGTALAAQFANTALKVTVAYTAANAYVTVTALTGYPTYQVVLGATGTMTNTSQMAGVAIASSTVASPSVVTSTAHGLVNGSVITIASADDAKLASGTYVVQYLTANTYSMYTLYGNPVPGVTGTTTATVVKVPGASVGNGTLLSSANAAGVLPDSSLSAIAAGAGYAVFTVNYNLPVAGTPISPGVTPGNTIVLYIKQWATTTTATYTTNFAALILRINEYLSNYVAGGTIASHTALTDSISVLDSAPAA